MSASDQVRLQRAKVQRAPRRPRVLRSASREQRRTVTACTWVADRISGASGVAKYSAGDGRTARAPKLVCVDEHLGGKLQVALAREDVRDDERLQHDLGADEGIAWEHA